MYELRRKIKLLEEELDELHFINVQIQGDLNRDKERYYHFLKNDNETFNKLLQTIEYQENVRELDIRNKVYKIESQIHELKESYKKESRDKDG